MAETAKLEYRVRTAPRYYVTRYHADAEGASGVETKGVYDSIEVACEVAYALCKAEQDKLGFAPGDDRIVYPEMPPSGVPAMEDINGFNKSPASAQKSARIATSHDIGIAAAVNEYALADERLDPLTRMGCAIGAYLAFGPRLPSASVPTLLLGRGLPS